MLLILSSPTLQNSKTAIQGAKEITMKIALAALAEVVHGAAAKASCFSDTRYEELELHAEATIVNFDPKAFVKLQGDLEEAEFQHSPTKYYRLAVATRKILTQVSQQEKCNMSNIG
eukprot:3115561-Amphidinium_carterae.3